MPKPPKKSRNQPAAPVERRRRALPLFVLAGLALTVVCALVAWGAWRPRGALPRHVLLVTIDTLRADAVGAYGGSSAATPLIDRLAAGGVRFATARAHNVLTLPSHANILTGRLPPDHGVRDNAGFRLTASQATLATMLKGLGYRTGAFISAFPLDSRFGLARGFDIYDDGFVDAAPRPAFLEQERRGAETVAAAVRWIDARRKDGGPWFAWVHLYEPHYPYAPPEPYASRFKADPYRGEVAATDAALAPLLQPILDAGGASDTLVVLTSDHGESLGDHGEATHGIFAYEAGLRVPLIVHYPPRLGARVVEAEAAHVDVVPMILDAIGQRPVEGLRGRTIAALERRRSDEAVTYFEALSGTLNRGWAPLSGVVSKGMKYIDLPIPELYDLGADPAERQNLAPSRPQEVDERRALLRMFGGGDVTRADETPDVRERLRALGYVSSTAPAKQVYTDADDPKRLIGIENELQEIVGLYLQGRLRDALARARALVGERPAMRIALLQLAHLQREAGELEPAIATLRQSLAAHPGDAESASLLGAYLTAANQPRDAVELLQPFAAAPDADVQVLVALSLAQARAGSFAAARDVIGRASAADPSNTNLLVTAGTVDLMAGERAQARQAFEKALSLNPDLARAHSSLAALAAEEGRRDESLAHWRRALALDANEAPALLAVGLSLVRRARPDEGRAYIALFAELASPRYAEDVARARAWLSSERR
jgi:arylsulfatase A-like enzyme/Tfp pilus assembly protein PilF